MIKLGDFATVPLYNIKAVVKTVNISPSTLRAWERRYDFCTPHRTDSGYRLYSDQDVAVIRWLKLQVDSGMAISQAVIWYQSLIGECKTADATVLPAPNASQFVLSPPSDNFSPQMQHKVRSFDVLRQDLVDALISYKDIEADQLLKEAFGAYSFEDIGEQLISPVLIEIGTRWHTGLLSVAREHYATNFLREYLLSVLRSSRQNLSATTIWIGCAPLEQHEIGAILLAIYLKRMGYRIKYLGQNLPLDKLADDIKIERPSMLILSASMLDSAQELVKLTQEISALNMHNCMIGYGGQIFNDRPELHEQVRGVYLGESGLQGVQMIKTLLANKEENL